MGQRWFVGDFRTGQHIMDIPVAAGSWSDGLNEIESIQATVAVRDARVARLDLPGLEPWRHYLAVDYDGTVMAAGPIMSATYDHDNGSYQIAAKGAGEYFRHRVILKFNVRPPYNAPLWYTTTKTRNPDPGISVSGRSLRGVLWEIVYWVIQWPNTPLCFLNGNRMEAGPHTRTYWGTDLKNAWEAIEQLTEVEMGIDVAFRPRWSDQGRSTVVWDVLGGTPFLARAERVRWDLTRPSVNLSGLNVGVSGADLATRTWVSAGRSVDEPIFATAENTDMLDAGHMSLDHVDTGHGSIEVQSTAQGWANINLAERDEVETQVSFNVRSDGVPFVTEHWPGDWVELWTDGTIPHLADYNQMRLVGRSGSAGSAEVSLDLRPTWREHGWVPAEA